METRIGVTRVQIKSKCNISTNAIAKGTMKLEEKDIATNEYFKYFGFIFQSSGDIQQDVTHKIKCGRQKWRATTGI